MAEDKIEVVPAVDDRFIREFIEFSIISCPVEYCREKFVNPWFFDSENKLVCVSGKQATSGVGTNHPRGRFNPQVGTNYPRGRLISSNTSPISPSMQTLLSTISSGQNASP